MDLTQIFSGYGWIFVPIGLFLGLLGYRAYRISLFLVALLAGLALGVWVGSKSENSQLYLILGLIIGAILGLVSHFLVRLSFFVLGMVGGLVLSFPIIEQAGLDLEATGELILQLASSLVGGILTVLLYRSLILVFTSVVGTYLIYHSTIHFFPSNSDNWSWILYAILLLVFIVVQISSRKSHPNPVERNR